MASIHERLLTTEEALLLAAIDGTSALDAFSETLQVLFEDIEQADGLSKETTELAYAVASRVAIYAETFHDLYLDNESISSGMMNEVEDILAHLSVADELSMSSIPSLACIQTDQSSNKTEKLAVAPLNLHVGVAYPPCLLLCRVRRPKKARTMNCLPITHQVNGTRMPPWSDR